ncbi:MAG: isoprenylcysteine carboxylmethyltransferase family protein [Actinomycetia bacterium]|nr:isoprenylcysteine carboxylmethyltransferase family protein [Actinomycetes bacterium]
MKVINLAHWITLGSFIFWLIVYWQAGRKVISDIQSTTQNKEMELEKTFMKLMAIFTLIITGTAILIVLHQDKKMMLGKSDVSLWLTVLGSILTVVGVIGMFYTRNQLGKYWVAETALQQEQEVVDKDLYGIVRHPIYTFAITAYLGFGLVFRTWWNMLLVGVIILFYILKAGFEEKVLAESLIGYKEYQKRVRYRLLPWVW